MKLLRSCFLVVVPFLVFLSANLYTQDKLYRNTFPLCDVSLLDGPFKHARDLNLKTLLQYDVDRLLAPYRKEAGLQPKAASYPNWDGLDGHVGGHYLSAMAMNYAATGNPECKRRMEYMISELNRCQEANTRTNAEWGAGYLGGIPNSSKLWNALRKGDLSIYRAAWAPWYNIHKMYAGLRDAWNYCGNEEAKKVFLNLCDWGIAVTSALSDSLMQAMLDSEHGGMPESFADAYQMTGNCKYLAAAKRFSHRMLLDPISSGKDNLDNKHANTQIPKVIGFQRIAELSSDKTYADAADFFWRTVTSHRSLVFGGNSRKEHFPSVNSCTDFIDDVEGPESCNSYNMLKLTEDLFRVYSTASYMDYYERTLYNHILSTQHPEQGGYVYFTPARPRHYRVYSTPNQAMWCCVGTGMENHSKYNQLIYAHQNDSLFLNLFIASELNWKDKGIKIRQETLFPDEERTRINITEGTKNFTLMVRYPSWVSTGGLRVLVNGKEMVVKNSSYSYIPVTRNWKKGDVVEIFLPMRNSVEQLPNVPEYIAFLHGPILLAAKTGTEDLAGLFADDGRWGQIPSGKQLPIDQAPIIIEDQLAQLPLKLKPDPEKPLTFTFADIKLINSRNLVLEPFFRVHDARYMMYWMALTNNQYKSYTDSVASIEKEKIVLNQRTVDFITPGQQQPEVDHAMQVSSSKSGAFQDEFWRDASNGGFFSYILATKKKTELILMVRYWGYEWGPREFDIYIDDEKLLTENNTGRWYQSRFQNVEYVIPEAMLKNKDHIRVKFQAKPKSTAGAVYSIRLVEKK